MGDSCKLTPVVFRRKGTQIEEVPSKLFKDIKAAVQDNDGAWRMWAYTKTSEFKRDYGGTVEYDELGEVTFPSLIKALGLEDAYEHQKGAEEAARDYGFKGQTFSKQEAVQKINDFNSKEENYVAIMERAGDGHTIKVLNRTAPNIEAARQQSFNNALNNQLLNLLRSMGFDISFINDPKFAGMFAPEEATFSDGLLQIIQIAKGELGEEALPEEFSHLIIEGLITNPLVQRLLRTIDEDVLHEVLGGKYEDYYNEYNGDTMRLKKEAAGQMLAQFITNKGTIKPETMQKGQTLLQRLWNWAKEFFSQITNKKYRDAQERAHDSIAGIYNMIVSGEVVRLVDKNSIINAKTLYKIKEEFNTVEKLANAALTLNAGMIKSERQSSMTGRVSTDSAKSHIDIRNAAESESIADQASSIMMFIKDCQVRFVKLATRTQELEEVDKVNGLDQIRTAREIAKCCRSITEATEGYAELLDEIATFDDPENLPAGMDPEFAKDLADEAKISRDLANKLNKFAHDSAFNILYAVSRTVYAEDTVRGIGSRRNEVMSLKEILEHAEKDINLVDRWLSALSDADDSLLTLFDAIVKNQQYHRDMEMIDINARISMEDDKLRRAGFSSDFMLEKDSEEVPTGRIISIYDWETYNQELYAKQQELRDAGITGEKYRAALQKWKNKIDKEGNKRLIPIFINKEVEDYYNSHKNDLSKTMRKYPEAVYEMVPNPAVYSKYADRIERLAPAQRDYYNAMIELKKEMMCKIPHRGQAIYRAIYISKDFVEGILDNSTGNIAKATKEQFVRKFSRRPDDIGFGTNEDFQKTIEEIILREENEQKAAVEIINTLADATDEDIHSVINPRDIRRVIKLFKRNAKSSNEKFSSVASDCAKEILSRISSENFYLVDTDFAHHRIQKLPIYYTRRLKDMKMLSTDFSGCMTAYSAMAVNYEKMNEVVDIIEVGRDYVRDQRTFWENKGNGPLYSRFQAFDRIYKGFVERAGNGTNTIDRLDDYVDSVIYEERKEDMGGLEAFGVNIDYAKTLDAIKDYTGLLGLGLNLFSTLSNVAVGKIQQWIEAAGGEYFGAQDYAKAVRQYGALLPGCMAEIAEPVKKNKLSLLIQMFDPMGDYYDSLRDTHHSQHILSRILGNNALGFIGMNAGEHILHCQTMLAILNATKLVYTKDTNGHKAGEKISLYDALKVVKDDRGIYKLELEENLAYEKDVIDLSGGTYKDDKGRVFSKNPNYGKPVRDENGRIKKETVALKNLSDNATQRYIFKKKKVIRKVNDSLNGAFGVNDKGAIHKKAWGRLIMQFRQWMPAHYMRRFAGAHYDADLEQWREGYYVTVYKFMQQLSKDIIKGQAEFNKAYIEGKLGPHELANIRRACAEVSLFMMLLTLVRLGGKVKDYDRSWLNKMALYQIRRMYLEVGASVPGPMFFKNLITLMQQPAAAVSTFDRMRKMVEIYNIFDEVQTGRYQGWSEYSRDAFQATPYLPQIYKAIDFDDSMFSMFEKDD